MSEQIITGDALSVLSSLPENSIDAICTDPPSAINFMGKEWDSDKGGRHQWIAWLARIMKECLRVLKPGGHALIWALPRTSHWTATAIEDAGFEIRDKIHHLFGSGFPKSLDVSKAIDRMKRVDREIVGEGPYVSRRPHADHSKQGLTFADDAYVRPAGHTITAPATPEAQQWEGYGTALKPAVEEWILARKPLAEPSIAANVLTWGTGGINVDGCRIASEGWQRPTTQDIRGGKYNSVEWQNLPDAPRSSHPQGRFPSHLLLSHSLFCTDDECHISCPVSHLDQQSADTRTEKPSASGKGGWRNQYVGGTSPAYLKGTSYYDTGGASRYFQSFHPLDELDIPWLYMAKADREERNAGLYGLPEQVGVKQFNQGMEGKTRSDGTVIKEAIKQSNNHPTVKPLSLMRWLVRLITPPGGTVLDCFAGSGSTLVACVKEGFHFIGIEQDASYCEIAQARVDHAQGLWKESEALP